MILAKTKILYLCSVGYIGGAERFILNILEEHQKLKNFEVMVCLLNGGEIELELKRQKINYVLLPFALRLSRPLQVLRTVKFLRSLVSKENINLVHSTMPYAHLLLSIALIGKPKIKRVWFQHGPVGGMLDRMASLFPVDKILFNSKYLQEWHNRTLFQLAHLTKQSIFPLAIKSSFFLEKHKKKNTEGLRILALGRIYEWKGYDLLIEALGLMPSQLLTELKLGLHIQGKPQGKDGEAYLAKLKELVKDLKLSSFVSFHDFNLSVEVLLHESHLLVHGPRGAEPFGYIVAEAMASRCLVIGNNKGGVAELLSEGRGYSFDSNSSSAILDLKQILEKIFIAYKSSGNLEIYQTQLDAAQDYIVKNHHMNKVYQSLSQIYLGLLEPKVRMT